MAVVTQLTGIGGGGGTGTASAGASKESHEEINIEIEANVDEVELQYEGTSDGWLASFPLSVCKGNVVYECYKAGQ